MTTSGTYTFTLAVGEVIDEAAERCGLDPAKLNERHLISARKSLNLLQIELENDKVDVPFRIDHQTIPIKAYCRGAVLPVGTLDILDCNAIVTSGGVNSEYALARTHRLDYSRIVDKTQNADRPYEYWVDLEKPSDLLALDNLSPLATGQTALTQPSAKDPNERRPVIIVRPRPTTTINLSYYRLRHHQDAGYLSDSVDHERRWWPAITAGLAAYMAEKFAPEREMMLRQKFEMQVVKAIQQSTDLGYVIIGGSAFGRNRHYRR